MKRFALVTTAALIALTGCATEPPPVSEKVQQYYDQNVANAKPTLPSATRTATAAPSLKPLPAQANVLIFGDSWTRGRGADDPATQGYAPVLGGLMGWRAEVAGEGGTGYLNPGSGKQVPYTERAKAIQPAAAPDLIILQGSQNDASQDLTKLIPAANSVIDTFRQRFPNAQLLLIGPGIEGASQVNLTMAQVASTQKVPYIDEITRGWVTGVNAQKYLLPDAHPTTEGHAFLAQNLKATIQELTKP